ncbi:MAG: RluA family pseudouridine synthase [Candidatus Aminicenantes bacterium]|nr:MAG: RluA family pseudouridine synthase [Candidatus Aminicenantes bacterium]
MPKREFLVSPLVGLDQRLDVFLSEKIRDLTRSQIQKIVDEQKVKVNGVVRKSSYRLREGDRVELEYEIPEPEGIKPENIPLRLVYSDDHIVVIDKPSGMVVHPGAGRKHGTLVNALLYHFPEVAEVGPKERPGIVHRLDKETSGLMVTAKTQKAQNDLQNQFRMREINKLYLGLVWGKMPEKKGEITWSIGRHAKHGERMSIKTKKPRTAETQYTVQEEYIEFSLLEIRPLTGRTHQIRVHFSASGHPVVGDTRYGRRKVKSRCPRLFLHSSWLSFIHPETRERLEFSSSLPEDLKNFLEKQEKRK